MMSMKLDEVTVASEFAYGFDRDDSFDPSKVRMFKQSPRMAARPVARRGFAGPAPR